MLRAVAAFLALFLLLSLVVHLTETARFFGIAALIFFALDWASAHYSKNSRAVRVRKEPLQIAGGRQA